MSRFRCKRCGHCCIVARTIYLNKKEIESKKFEMTSKKKTIKKILKFIPELKRKLLVCIYYDPISHDCLIHKHKPEACKKFNCIGKKYPKKKIDEWMEYYKEGGK